MKELNFHGSIEKMGNHPAWPVRALQPRACECCWEQQAPTSPRTAKIIGAFWTLQVGSPYLLEPSQSIFTCRRLKSTQNLYYPLRVLLPATVPRPMLLSAALLSLFLCLCSVLHPEPSTTLTWLVFVHLLGCGSFHSVSMAPCLTRGLLAVVCLPYFLSICPSLASVWDGRWDLTM